MNGCTLVRLYFQYEIVRITVGLQVKQYLSRISLLTVLGLGYYMYAICVIWIHCDSDQLEKNRSQPLLYGVSIRGDLNRRIRPIENQGAFCAHHWVPFFEFIFILHHLLMCFLQMFCNLVPKTVSYNVIATNKMFDCEFYFNVLRHIYKNHRLIDQLIAVFISMHTDNKHAKAHWCTWKDQSDWPTENGRIWSSVYAETIRSFSSFAGFARNAWFHWTQ